MQRFGISLATIVCLSIACRLYSAVIVPMTEARASASPAVSAADIEFRPKIISEEAERSFPEEAWTHQARHVWQRARSSYLYTEKVERTGKEGDTVMMSPIAFVWRNEKEPGSPPYRLTAESGMIRFENSFFDPDVQGPIELSEKPGRIVSARLAGRVHIDGPDGLSIDGHHFIFSEETAELYSDYEVAFKHGPTAQDRTQVAGKGKGMALAFTRSNDGRLGADMPRVGGLAEFTLREDVSIECVFEQDGRWSRAQIACTGPFEYSFLKREASFERQVRVARFNHERQASDKDTLECEGLILAFDRDPALELEDPGGLDSRIFEGLTFRQMRAYGGQRRAKPQVSLSSQEYGLKATMQNLYYDAVRRIAEFKDDEGQVLVSRDGVQFECPTIVLQHAVGGGGLELMQCMKPGRITIADERIGQSAVTASWAGSLNVAPSADPGVHQISLSHTATLDIPGRAKIQADVLDLWATLDQLDAAPGASTAGHSLPLKRARAHGNVRMRSPQLNLRRANQIEVEIASGSVPSSAAGDAGTRGTGDETVTGRPALFEADNVKLAVVHDASHGGLLVREVVASDNVSLQYHPEEPVSVGASQLDGPVVLQGHQLKVLNEGGSNQVAILSGHPGTKRPNASASFGQALIQGATISVDRTRNRVDVEGQGGLRMPISLKSSDGTPQPPSMLVIVWKDRMEFNGRRMMFLGSVKASLPDPVYGDNTILCEELSAELSQTISLSAPPSEQQSVEFSKIQARHQVQVDSRSFEGNKLTGVRQAKLAEFTISQLTGDFFGQGPGEIDLWVLGSPMRFSRSDQVQANQPNKASPPGWRFINIDFEGEIRGNAERQQAILRDRVNVTSAPVPKAGSRFLRNQIDTMSPSGEPYFGASDSIWLGCDHLEILQQKHADQSEPMFNLFATQGVQLEGQKFRAVADELIYEQRAGKFLLRGLKNDAEIHIQRLPHEPPRSTSNETIEFYPADYGVKLGGSTGFSSGGF